MFDTWTAGAGAAGVFGVGMAGVGSSDATLTDSETAGIVAEVPTPFSGTSKAIWFGSAMTGVMMFKNSPTTGLNESAVITAERARFGTFASELSNVLGDAKTFSGSDGVSAGGSAAGGIGRVRSEER